MDVTQAAEIRVAWTAMSDKTATNGTTNKPIKTQIIIIQVMEVMNLVSGFDIFCVSYIARRAAVDVYDEM